MRKMGFIKNTRILAIHICEAPNRKQVKITYRNYAKDLKCMVQEVAKSVFALLGSIGPSL